MPSIVVGLIGGIVCAVVIGVPIAIKIKDGTVVFPIFFVGWLAIGLTVAHFRESGRMMRQAHNKVAVERGRAMPFPEEGLPREDE